MHKINMLSKITSNLNKRKNKLENKKFAITDKGNKRTVPTHVISNILNNFDSIYLKIKNVIAKKGMWNPDDDPNLFSDITLLGLSDSSTVIDFLKTRILPLSSLTYTSVHKTVHPAKLNPIPSELLHPPPLDSKGISYSALAENYIPDSKRDMYLNNFAVTMDKAPGFANKIDENVTFNQNVMHGRYSMFERCYRPRCHTTLQTLITNIFTYRCDYCGSIDETLNDERFNGCQCWRTSPSINAFLNYCNMGSGIPFLYKPKFQKIVKNDAYPVISSMLPCLMTAFLEIAPRTVLGCFDQCMECHTVNKYQDYARTTLFGSAMDNKGCISEFNEYILSRTNLTRFKTSTTGYVDGVEYLQADNEVSLVDHAEYVTKYGDVVDISKINGLTDYEGRWLISASQELSNVPMVIATAAVLSLKYSGQAMPGSGQSSVLEPTKWVKIEDVEIPIKFEPKNEDVRIMMGTITENIENHPPKLDDLETGFLEISTTNSAGLGKAQMDKLFKDMLPTWGAESEKFAALSNMRLIDALRHVQDVFTSIESYIYALFYSMKNVMIGSRMQLSRRQRSIFIPPTVSMLHPFLKMRVLDPYLRESAGTASGKTTGDIRDANQVLNNTSTPNTMNYSYDITGMDATTFITSLRLVDACVLSYLEKQRASNHDFFLNKADGKTYFVEITTYTKDDIGNKVYRTEKVSVLEYIAMTGMTLSQFEPIMRDGLFLAWAKGSGIIFFSGRFDTSDQNTAMNLAVEQTVAKVVKPVMIETASTTKEAVQGDDDSNQVKSLTSQGQKTASVAYEAKIQQLWETLGYELKPSKSKYTGEFLKLYGIAGALSPYHYRVPLFTSERGENFGRSLFGKVDDYKSAVHQLSGRSPRPIANYGLLMIGISVLGYLKVSFSTSNTVTTDNAYMTRSQLMRVDKANREFNINKLSNSSLRKIEWVDSVGNKNIISLLPGVWFCAPFVGVPLPHISIINSDGDVMLYQSAGSCLSFKSPAMCRDILRLCVHKSANFDSDLVAKMDYPAFLGWVNDTNNPQKPTMLRYMRTYNSFVLFNMLRAGTVTLLCNISNNVDRVIVDKCGLNHVYYLFDAMKSRPSRLTKVEFPRLNAYVEGADVFLDKGRSSAAYHANERLSNKYQMRVPNDMAYYKRLSSRISAAIAEQEDTIFLTSYKLDAMSSSPKSLHKRFISDLYYGDYYIIREERTSANERPVDFFKHGYGSGVPPNSLQALILNEVGTPQLNALSHKAVKTAINKDVIVKGVQDNILRVCAQFHTRGGDDALNDVFIAMGLDQRSSADIRTLIATNGSSLYTMPYTINPSQLYYYSVNMPYQWPTCFKTAFPGQSKLEYFILLSQLMHEPNLVRTTNSVIMGPYLARLLGAMKPS